MPEVKVSISAWHQHRPPPDPQSGGKVGCLTGCCSDSLLFPLSCICPLHSHVQDKLSNYSTETFQLGKLHPMILMISFFPKLFFMNIIQNRQWGQQASRRELFSHRGHGLCPRMSTRGTHPSLDTLRLLVKERLSPNLGPIQTEFLGHEPGNHY